MWSRKQNVYVSLSVECRMCCIRCIGVRVCVCVSVHVCDYLVHCSVRVCRVCRVCVCMPDCPGLESPQAVRQLRFQVQVLLDEATCEQRGRFGELLLMLPPLQSVAWHMVETLQLARLLGEARVDSLLQEMLLGEGAVVGHGAHTGETQIGRAHV